MCICNVVDPSVDALLTLAPFETKYLIIFLCSAIQAAISGVNAIFVFKNLIANISTSMILGKSQGSTGQS